MIHPVKIGGKQRGFQAAGAGADFDDGVARIRRVRRQNTELNLLGEMFFPGFQLRDFVFGHQRKLGIGRFTFEQGAVLLQVGQRFQIIFALRRQLLEPCVFARQFLRALRVVENLRIAQRGFDLGKTAREFFNVRTQVHFDL